MGMYRHAIPLNLMEVSQMGRKTKSLVVTETAVEMAARGAPSTGNKARWADSPLYGVALLRVAMELKKPGAQAVEDILATVLRGMVLPEGEFNAFL